MLRLLTVSVSYVMRESDFLVFSISKREKISFLKWKYLILTVISN
jgi:hypothetical protein